MATGPGGRTKGWILGIGRGIKGRLQQPVGEEEKEADNLAGGCLSLGKKEMAKCSYPHLTSPFLRPVETLRTLDMMEKGGRPGAVEEKAHKWLAVSNTDAESTIITGNSAVWQLCVSPLVKTFYTGIHFPMHKIFCC